MLQEQSSGSHLLFSKHVKLVLRECDKQLNHTCESDRPRAAVHVLIQAGDFFPAGHLENHGGGAVCVGGGEHLFLVQVLSMVYLRGFKEH